MLLRKFKDFVRSNIFSVNIVGTFLLYETIPNSKKYIVWNDIRDKRVGTKRVERYKRQESWDKKS